MKKLRNWRSYIIEKASELNGQEFVWGETDCGMLGRRLIQEAYEEDPFTWDPYESKTGAIKVYKKYGTPFQQLKNIGCKRVEPNFIQRGDFASVKDDNFQFLTVAMFVGSGYITSNPDTGVILLQREQINDKNKGFRLPDVIE